MWLATKVGFYSVVQHKNRKNCYIVRARCREDIENLINGIPSINNESVVETRDADYRFRLNINKYQFNALMGFLSNSVDYPNFKDEIKSSKQQKDKLSFYTKIWFTMLQFQENRYGVILDPFKNYFKSRYGEDSRFNTKNSTIRI